MLPTFEQQTQGQCSKHSVNNVLGLYPFLIGTYNLGRRLLTTNDMVRAATTVNQHWSSYVERTGLTAGNPEVGWWTDVQQKPKVILV